MDRIPVVSSNLKSVGYDEKNQILEIEFKGGAVYQYFNVPKYLYEALLAAPSKGQFFWRNIRDEFDYRRIK